jgi:Rieske Fe-S protein
MQRRDFLKSSCNACLLVATGFLAPAVLSGCGPGAYQVFSAEIKEDQITVPMENFVKGPLVLVRPKGWYYSIALRKKEDNSYTALLLKCTHQDNQLTADQGGFNCSLHGSAYNKDGRVTKGPAERALKSYLVTTENNQLVIHTKA